MHKEWNAHLFFSGAAMNESAKRRPWFGFGRGGGLVRANAEGGSDTSAERFCESVVVFPSVLRAQKVQDSRCFSGKCSVVRSSSVARSSPKHRLSN